MLIRDETPDDHRAIHGVVDAAFAHMPYSNQKEGDLVDALRGAGALTLSLVAEEAGEILGHVAVSPVTIDGAALGWFGLGPLAVLPARQRQGVGSALIEAALSRLRAAGAAGCVVFGEPAFYGRFGFAKFDGLCFAGGPPELFLGLSFGPETPRGSVDYHPSFALVG
ncbi:GNAT family N-acetyltransferase [Methylosinus sp. Sm6]|uniref:GNAT family N-acetyltransferase n=1 Tax=Methylosinus sp. Sm6 TaxID=2866948 RepID=UPI001C996234|nr:N-acetyltransferase [Methylosinus sp. Sm6]MBY6240188.1 N-acetyltransferase [Methylosinus sp. Sm6]